MNDEPISSDEFRNEVEDAASVLRFNGFQHAPQLDSETPTVISVVYVGKNIAFTFELDIRDQAIDLIVTRYRSGKLVATWDGGYSSSLFMHLINYCGFRGRSVPAIPLPLTVSKVNRMLSGLVNLLGEPCAANLLADREDALPR